MRSPWIAALAACLVFCARDAASQGDLRLTIHAGSADFLTLVGSAPGQPPALLRLLQSTPGSAADGTPVVLIGSAPSQCAASKSVAIHPNGRFIYLASDATPVGLVCVYEFDASALTLTPVIGSPFPAGRGTRAIAVDPAGRFVYAANFVDGNISGYSVNATTGELNPLNTSPYVSADMNTGFLVIDPLGRFVYSSNSDAFSTVSGFAIDRDTGSLTPVPFSPMQTAGTPGALSIDPRGRYLYVAASPNTVYAIDATTGKLTATTDTFAPFAQAMAIDPSGRYLYTTSGSGASSRVSMYRLTGSSVTAIGSIQTGSSPQGVAVSRDGRHVYTANQADGNVSGFRIDDASGALTPIEGSPFAGGGSVTSLATFGALASDATWKMGEPLARPIGVFGGRLPYTWAITGGALPPGLSFVADIGVVAGTPTTLGTYSFTARVTDAFAGTATRTFSFTVKSDVSVPTAVVVEYYNASLDHYFITWHTDEIAALDAGTTIKGWKRTSRTFGTYPSAQPGSSPICRYYIPPDQGDSHFFGRGTAECNATGAQHPSFELEDPTFMYMILPSEGTCPAGTIPVYRVFSNRADANHRYMTDRALRDAMVAMHWIAEGDGPDRVVMCAPQ
jgi:6-phosphogluconolactonase (cycloisomerase 2 family)